MDEIAGADVAIDGISNALQPNVVIRRATVERVLAALSAAPFTGIWFMGHGNDSGLAFGDEYIDVWALIEFISAAQAQWIILNSCHGAELVRLIQLATPAHVVASSTLAGLPADVALRSGQLLAESIARRKGKIVAAYDAALPGGANHYQLYVNRQGGNVRHDSSGVALALSTLEQRLDVMERTVGALRTAPLQRSLVYRLAISAGLVMLAVIAKAMTISEIRHMLNLPPGIAAVGSAMLLVFVINAWPSIRE